MKFTPARAGIYAFSLIAVILAIAAGAQTYREWKTSREFPFRRTTYRVKNGAIRVLRSKKESLLIRMDHPDDACVSFHTEQKDLGSVYFRPPYFEKSIIFDPKSLGEASFVTIRVQDGGDIQDLKVFGNHRNPKFFILALDGATWRILLPMIQAGLCPNFKSLMKEGSYGKLISEEPTYSPVIWTSIATGKGPEAHGVTFYIAQNQPITSDTVQIKRFWNIFSEYSNLTSLIVGWYLTWPVEAIHGGIISDRTYYNSRSKDIFYPADTFEQDYFEDFTRIQSELEQRLVRFTSFRYDVSFQRKYPKGTPERQVQQIVQKRLASVYRRDESYVQIGLKALKGLEPDVLAIYLRGADFTEHGFWKYMDPESVSFFPVSDQERIWFGETIRNYYIYLDEALGKFLQTAAKDTTVFVLSDHGFGPIPKEEAGDPELSGAHEIQGILFCKGPGFRKGFEIQNASIYDFLPTLLHAAGLPVAEDMKGGVLMEAFKEKHPVRKVKSYGARKMRNGRPSTDAMDEEIRQELRSLGYIQ
jgi:predicted AlkP superfamily phosphohydrolase/phosphomutase